MIIKERFKAREYHQAVTDVNISEVLLQHGKITKEQFDKSVLKRDKLHEELAYLHHEIELEKQKFYKSKGEY